MNELLEGYNHFVKYGEFRLSIHYIPEVLRLLDLDIAEREQRINQILYIVKVENIPLGHPMERQIRAELKANTVHGKNIK